MTFDFKKYAKQLHESYSDTFSLHEIEEIIDIRDEYNQDSPLSTGNRLLIERVEFDGTKSSGEPIHFQQELSSGINIWVADNLKGKSSLFQIIRFALTGRDSSLKKDIKGWIHHILLVFSIGKISYSTSLDLTRSRLKANFYDCSFESLEQVNGSEIKPFRTAKNKTEYEKLMQDFFFKSFSLYALNWTQKNPSKDSSDLLDSQTRWATYYKSIFLESKDSNSLIYGGQSQKVFQILLGLELTYAVNRLTVKKDKVSYEAARLRDSFKIQTYEDKDEKDNLEKELQKIEEELLVDKKTSPQCLPDLSLLYEKYNKLQSKIRDLNGKQAAIEEKNRKLYGELSSIKQSQDAVIADIKEIKKQIDRVSKDILDLEEYIEIGVLFSDLDIKQCPSCSCSITKPKINTKECVLCNRSLEEQISEKETQERYRGKIKNLQSARLKLQDQKKLASLRVEELEREYQHILDKREKLLVSSDDMEEVGVLQLELKAVEEEINNQYRQSLEQQEKLSYRTSLIEKRAVIQFKLQELLNTESKAIDSNSNKRYEVEKEILTKAIQQLTDERYKKGKDILSKLSELILKELHVLGLTSVEEVYITNKFNIQYLQNQEALSFNDFAEGEQLRVKLAFYLSLIQLDIVHSYGRHPRLLIIDSPGKEEGDAQYLDGLIDILKSIETRFGGELQILIGTAEREFTNVVKNQKIIGKNKYLF